MSHAIVLREDVPLRHSCNLTLVYHRHHLIALDGLSGSTERAKAQPRIGAAFEKTMVLFHDVVEGLALPQRRAYWELALLLEGLKCW